MTDTREPEPEVSDPDLVRRLSDHLISSTELRTITFLEARNPRQLQEKSEFRHFK